MNYVQKKKNWFAGKKKSKELCINLLCLYAIGKAVLYIRQVDSVTVKSFTVGPYKGPQHLMLVTNYFFN